MVRLRRLDTTAGEEFGQLAILYQEAFPLEERRDLAMLASLVEHEPRMHFNAVECDGKLAGFLIFWDFGDFYFLEHLAVFAGMRNMKVGKQVLDWVAEHLDGIRILEAEPEDGAMASRRIHYYERNGYSVVDKTYHQPSYRAGGKGVDLWVMSNREDPGLSRKLDIVRKVVYAL